MSERRLLFVYGSLKRGCSNHWALENAEFVRECRTAPHYRLWDLGSYPGLTSGGEFAVLGELYLVSGALILRLDAFEGREYVRAQIQLENDTHAEAYLLTDAARARALELAVDAWTRR
ncbi:MAG: gamma-glutamylcyclotransferase family protein [Myxococcota bacterium]